MKQLYLVTTLLLLVLASNAQEKQYKVGAIGFYNLENLFDTLDDPNKWDEQFLPDGEYHYTGEIYQEKLQHLSKVISELGTEMTPDGVSILGVAEIENRKVLEDLVIQPSLKSRGYEIMHHESPDRRGVDVGLIYNPKYFQVEGSKNLFVLLPLRDDGDTSFTRDILWVWGQYDGEPMHIFVNHWPSRRGGQAASNHLREKAASVAQQVIDSILKANPDTKVLLMGDLNDDPTNSSVNKVLGANGNLNKIKRGDLYNPYYSFYKKGIGTLAWNDAWNLFDQIIISSSFLEKDQKGFFFLRNEVYNKKYLTQSTGNWKGYPHRTYVGGQYQGGYSDHFPVFIYLVKEVN